MQRVLIALLVLLAACGGSDEPATSDPASSDLVAHCGAAELAVTDQPQLPSELLNDEDLLALDEAMAAVGGEMEIFPWYNWFVAERSGDRLVLFGTAIDLAEAEVPYADATLIRTEDGWRPERWGQCRIETAAPSYGNARWVLAEEPGVDATELSILINERECANGEPPLGREIRSVVVAEVGHITITVLVEPIKEDANCLSNPWHPTTVELGEPLGGRALRDGSTIPPVIRVFPPVDDDYRMSGG